MVEGARSETENIMKDVAPAYLERKRADVSRYRQYLASGDLESIRVLGHQMKGTGAGYGFPALTDFGSAIEAAAGRGDHALLAGKVEELATYLSSMEST